MEGDILGSDLMREFEATRRSLLREHRALRKRKEEYLKWQYRMHILLGHAFSSLSSKKQQPSRETPWRVRLKQPMTVQECHVIAKSVYVEVQAFTETTNFLTSGSSVFGWTDRRQVDSGLLKFSLQKLFPHYSAHEMIKQTWDIVTHPEKHKRLYSSSLNMRCEHVQTVDDSNKILYQEFHVRERHPTTGDELDSMIIVRSLVLNTLFETEHGYVILSYGLDADRLADLPPEEQILMYDGMNIKYEWLSIYDWCTSDRSGPNGEQCKAAFVGAMPEEAAVNVQWAIEILFMVLRWENLAVGPVLVLANDRDEENEHQNT